MNKLKIDAIVPIVPTPFRADEEILENAIEVPQQSAIVADATHLRFLSTHFRSKEERKRRLMHNAEA